MNETIKKDSLNPKENSFYDEYTTHRRPWTKAENSLRWFHFKLFRQFSSVSSIAVQDMNFVEVGVGFGYLPDKMESLVKSYTGIDMNKKIVDAMNASNRKAILGSVPPFPPELSKETNVIWMSNVLEHARDWQHAREMLASAYNALAKSGELVIVCPDLYSWKEEFWSGDWSHGFPTTLRRTEQILNDVGFTVTYKKHHTCAQFNPFCIFFLDRIFSLIPIRVIDYFFFLFFKKTFAYSFMTVFGWRQIFLIGKKA